MKISFIQAILIGVVYYLGVTGTPWLSLLGSISFMQKPLVAGTVVGIILGDPVQGVIIGAAIQLPYIAFISAGGTAPVDPGLAGTLGTALAIASGADPQTAVTLAMPIGLLGTVIWVAHMTIDVFFVHMADKAAGEGDLDRINFLHVVPPQIILFLISVIPVTLAAYYGAGAVTTILGYLDTCAPSNRWIITSIGDCDEFTFHQSSEYDAVFHFRICHVDLYGSGCYCYCCFRCDYCISLYHHT